MQTIKYDGTAKGFGYSVCEGVILCLFKYFIFFMISIFVITLFCQVFVVGVDDSDISTFKRSGMKIRTDALTGQQYLESSSGYLTPRIGTAN